MSGYLTRLASRTLEPSRALRPEVPSMFAPPATLISARKQWDPTAIPLESEDEATREPAQPLKLGASQRQTPELSVPFATRNQDVQSPLDARQAGAARPAQNHADREEANRDSGQAFHASMPGPEDRTALPASHQPSATKSASESLPVELGQSKHLPKPSHEIESNLERVVPAAASKPADAPTHQVPSLLRVDDFPVASKNQETRRPSQELPVSRPSVSRSGARDLPAEKDRSELASDLVALKSGMPPASTGRNVQQAVPREPGINLRPSPPSQESRSDRSLPHQHGIPNGLRAGSFPPMQKPHLPETVIQVSIGRVEVRAQAQPPSKSAAREAAKGPSLEEYLRGRTQRGLS